MSSGSFEALRTKHHPVMIPLGIFFFFFSRIPGAVASLFLGIDLEYSLGFFFFKILLFINIFKYFLKNKLFFY